jgi:membrane protein
VSEAPDDGPGATAHRGAWLSAFWSVARQTLVDFLAESPLQLSAALSFYTLLSLSPLVLVVVGVTGVVWSAPLAREQLLAQIEQVVGPAGAQTIEMVLTSATDRGRSTISVLVGIVTLVVGATTVFGQLQAALNQIWKVEARPTRSALGGLVRTRLLSLGLVLLLGFLLFVSVVMSTALAALHASLSSAGLVASGRVWRVVNFVVSLAVLTLLIAMVFKVLPDVRIAWSYVWIGAAVTAILFGVGRFLIGLYLSRASIASSYGAAGSLVVFLLWVYYSSLIFLFGAEFTRVLARRRGAVIEPLAHAVIVRSD